MDLTSLDTERSRHQYHIYANDSLGERLNDCWAFTHDESQHWFSLLGEEWNASTAAVFHTTRTPHTSAPLPGEEISGPLWTLSEAASALRRSLADGSELDCEGWGVQWAGVDLSDEDLLPAVRGSIDEMRALLRSLPEMCRSRDVGTFSELASGTHFQHCLVHCLVPLTLCAFLTTMLQTMQTRNTCC